MKNGEPLLQGGWCLQGTEGKHTDTGERPLETGRVPATTRAGREAGTSVFLIALGGNRPCCKIINFCCFQGTQTVVICYYSPRKLKQICKLQSIHLWFLSLINIALHRKVNPETPDYTAGPCPGGLNCLPSFGAGSLVLWTRLSSRCFSSPCGVHICALNHGF